MGRIRLAAWPSARAPMTGGLHLDVKERRNLALSYALDSVWEGVEAAVKATAEPAAVRAMVSALLSAYMMMLVAPEPMTQFVAVALSALLPHVPALISHQFESRCQPGWETEV